MCRFDTRLAGVLYLAIILLGITAEAILRGPLVDPDNAAATAAAVRAAPLRFHLGTAADLVMALCDVGLAALLYALFRPVSPVLALVAMVFRLVEAAGIGANLTLLQGAWLVVASPAGSLAEADALAALLLHLHAHGYDLALAFFAVNSLTTGALIWRSGFVPRFIGVGIAAAGAVYLTGSFLRILAPGLAMNFAPAYVLPLVAESAFCLWLLIGKQGFGLSRQAIRARRGG